jgi:hypothetical protein
MTEPRIQSFREFWPFYVGEHRVPLNRLLHYVGTGGGYALLIAAVVVDWRLVFAAAILGYGNAWFGHFIIEKNKPASFRYPIWSFFADAKMLSYGLTGRMGKEIERLYGSRAPAPDAPLLVRVEA